METTQHTCIGSTDGVDPLKIKPIIFSTLMVKSILCGWKKMTRRLVCKDDFINNPGMQLQGLTDNKRLAHFGSAGSSESSAGRTTKYVIGDILWVRETFFYTGKYKSSPLFLNAPDFYYLADEDVDIGDHKWSPSIHMPKAAARIFLKVTNVRIERLQDISDEDAIAEGIDRFFAEDVMSYLFYPPKNKKKAVYIGPCEISGTYIAEDTAFFNERPAYHSFRSLWDSINGDGSWHTNPWVWIYEFERVECPVNFLNITKN